ncbi:hypothetical protein TNCV_4507141 [Trichonephila clavipes]|nr:hypothetical protein TNCV_4507141 [Trichonephila clavipes]
MATGSYMTPIYSRSQSEIQGDLHTVTIRLRNGSISFRLARALQMDIQTIMFFGVNWCGTQTSSFFLNPTLLKWLKTVLWLIFSSWAMLRLLTSRSTSIIDYFCDFIDFFDYGRGAILTSKMPEHNR